jgi:hypothetical protein
LNIVTVFYKYRLQRVARSKDQQVKTLRPAF